MEVLEDIVRGSERPGRLDRGEDEVEVVLCLRRLVRLVLHTVSTAHASAVTHTYKGRVLGKHDQWRRIVRATRQTLPELLRDERHEGVQETETVV